MLLLWPYEYSDMVDALAWKAEQEAEAYKSASANNDNNNNSTGANNNSNSNNNNEVLSGDGTRNYFAAKFTKYKT